MKIAVTTPERSQVIEGPAGAKLLSHLQSAELYVNAACGGRGSCQKCRIQLKEGFLGITAADRKAFRDDELREGWRLSCQALPRASLSIFIPQTKDLKAKPRVVRHGGTPGLRPRLICDLGSTGVVMALCDESGHLVVESHLLNRQVKFGDDVMTRLEAAQKGGGDSLQVALFETLDLCLRSLAEAEPAAVPLATQQTILCAGNSAMTSFLHATDIASLAVSPFQPASRESHTTAHGAVRYQTLPLLGGFVGGDTVAGILALQKSAELVPWMLVDIGTNTEIVLCDGEKLWFTSAPAGPAFEGGNISIGMRAEPGAISTAAYRDGAWKFSVIGGDSPRGLCGSGLLDVLWESVRNGWIHPDGLVPAGRMILTDSLALSADDVREFQLAKSATRSACELIMDRAGVRPRSMTLAGTFASFLNPASIQGLGLLPPGIPLKTIGNASLKGTAIYAAMSESERNEAIAKLEKMRHPLELALQDDFQAVFVRNLNLSP